MLKRIPALMAALFLCGFRPFFLFAAASAVLAIGAWAGFLLWAWPLPEMAGGPMVWHAHEMVLGFALAAVVGFVVTAVPEFTASAGVASARVKAMAAAWLAARVGALAGGMAGTALAAVATLALLMVLVATVAPALWRGAERRHVSFLWGLLGLLLSTAGFYVEALAGGDPLRWLQAAIGILMVLIVIALSRISMRIVNGALELAGETGREYLARPPRRNLAVFAITLYTAIEFFLPLHPVAGWVALATAAALFNLLNDWFVGRVLFGRWVFMLQGVYWLMAAGYALIGWAILGGGLPPGAGRHLLTIGALGLAVFVVMNIAGRVHAGLEPDPRAWVPVAAAMLVAAAVARVFIYLPGAGGALFAAVLLWVLPFGLVVIRFWPLYSRPRADGRGGCDGIGDID